MHQYILVPVIVFVSVFFKIKITDVRTVYTFSTVS